jgi:hypothetical protein
VPFGDAEQFEQPECERYADAVTDSHTDLQPDRGRMTAPSGAVRGDSERASQERQRRGAE